MNNIGEFQSNEILTAISILSSLRSVEKMEIMKCLLIEPLFSYKSIRTYVKRANSKVRSIEELIIKKNVVFSNFDKRFIEKLPLSINAILLLVQLKLIKIDGKYLIFDGEEFDFNEKSLGKIAQEAIIVSDRLAKILIEEEASSLYLSLRIEL
ncbi:three component ABC system middle component [Clostridium perfringens]|uniref:three component ABC system middle component n=1 Tax=Clostridium perfringens TaxID=1502 RepID=UPI0032DB1402